MRRNDWTQVEVKVTQPTETELVVELPEKPTPYELQYEVPDKVITDTLEKVDCILEMNGLTKDYLKQIQLEVLTLEDWTKKYLHFNSVVTENEFIYKLMYSLYPRNKKAYLVVNGQELYGQINLLDIPTECKTPYGRMEIPTVCVDNTAVLFPASKVLTDNEVSAYENNRNFNKLNVDILEREIMGKLLDYVRNKDLTVEESKTLWKTIEDYCKTVSGLKSVKFIDWILSLTYGWRFITDIDNRIGQIIAPPFKINIDFNSKTLNGESYHPHNLRPNLCLGWYLTQLKDRCFQSKDIYWLVVGMAQFWNQWTTSDAMGTDRDARECCLRYLDNSSSWELFNDLPKEYVLDIVKAIYSKKNSLTWVNDWYIKTRFADIIKPMFRDKEFVKALQEPDTSIEYPGMSKATLRIAVRNFLDIWETSASELYNELELTEE